MQAKICNPDLNIVVVEKYIEYKRDNNLRLDRDSFKDIPQDERLKGIVDGFFNGKKNAMVQTKEIECQLKKYAEDLRIKFEYGEIKSAGLSQSDASIIICADGAHSVNRKEFVDKKN